MSPLQILALLAIWSLYGILWTMFSDHEWTEPRDTFLAGPLYWTLNLLHYYNILSFSDDYGEDLPEDFEPEDESRD